MSNLQKKNPRQGLLASIFAKASRLGISSDDLREEIAPAVIKKRLSGASTQELYKMVEHLAGLSSERPAPPQKRYTPSRKGLIEELEDLARDRWGEDFDKSLNTFINSHRKISTHYYFLDIRTLKGIKDRIRQLNDE